MHIYTLENGCQPLGGQAQIAGCSSYLNALIVIDDTVSFRNNRSHIIFEVYIHTLADVNQIAKISDKCRFLVIPESVGISLSIAIAPTSLLLRQTQ